MELVSSVGFTAFVLSRSKQSLDFVNDEVPSAQADEALFVPAVQETGDGEACLAQVCGQVFHLDDKLCFSFAVWEKLGEEVAHTFFCIIELAGKEGCGSSLCTSREGVEHIETEYLALHQMVANQRFAYAHHLDISLCEIGAFVGWSEAEEPV